MKESSPIWLKEKCTYGKCGGNLYLERKFFGYFEKKCLLCSRELELTKRQLRDIKKEGLW